MKASRLLVTVAIGALAPLATAFAQTPTPDPSATDPSTTNSSSTMAQPAQDSSQQQGASFDSLDKDGDGRISKAEAAADPNVTAQFSRYDKNGDGYIDRAEVSQANNPPPVKQQ